MDKKNKQKSTIKKQQEGTCYISKKDLQKLKLAYKAGKLKFDSKELADSVLKDVRHGLTK